MKAEPDIAGARLLATGHVTPEPGWHMRLHSHTIHELIVVVGGAMSVTHEGRRTDAAVGDVLLYPAGLRHEEWSDRAHPLESVFLTFECPGLEGCGLIRASDEQGRIRQMARWLHEDSRVSMGMAWIERSSLLQAILAEFVRSAGAGELPLVDAVRRHVRERMAERITLAALARRADMSKFHFLRVYRAAAGRTPMQDVRMLRAHYARELVLGTNLPLKEIAVRAGLGDEYSMSRLFSKLFRMPPGRYRRFHRRPGPRGTGRKTKSGKRQAVR